MPRLVVTGAVETEKKTEKLVQVTTWKRSWLCHQRHLLVSCCGERAEMLTQFFSIPRIVFRLPQIPQIIRGKRGLGETTFCSGDQACDEEL